MTSGGTKPLPSFLYSGLMTSFRLFRGQFRTQAKQFLQIWLSGSAIRLESSSSLSWTPKTQVSMQRPQLIHSEFLSIMNLPMGFILPGVVFVGIWYFLLNFSTFSKLL